MFVSLGTIFWQEDGHQIKAVISIHNARTVESMHQSHKASFFLKESQQICNLNCDCKFEYKKMNKLRATKVYADWSISKIDDIAKGGLTIYGIRNFLQ